jgi:hypothetical protein
MPDLEVEGPVTESRASLDTFGTANAKVFVYLVFEIGLFDEFPDQCPGRTELVLSSGVQVDRTRYEIPPAQITIAAQVISVHTFYGRWIADTFRGTAAALVALKGIDLPHPVFDG